MAKKKQKAAKKTKAAAKKPTRKTVKLAAARKPALINAVIDPAAGSESGRIGNLNPQSVLTKK